MLALFLQFGHDFPLQSYGARNLQTDVIWKMPSVSLSYLMHPGVDSAREQPGGGGSPAQAGVAVAVHGHVGLDVEVRRPGDGGRRAIRGRGRDQRGRERGRGRGGGREGGGGGVVGAGGVAGLGGRHEGAGVRLHVDEGLGGHGGGGRSGRGAAQIVQAENVALK